MTLKILLMPYFCQLKILDTALGQAFSVFRSNKH